MMTIFAMMIMFITNFNNTGLSATTPGSYVEVINVQYDATNNTTYGDVVRYEVSQSGDARWMTQQVRSLPGHATKSDLSKTIVHDSGITLVQENNINPIR